ncbi:GNAT family N-acetyltransferase [Pedobacter sp. HMF7647]|uniref:GNAT family N-acetyltransferase n=1 Tax=Hufsiella arboris TaxID=2695275 RepID=A0A7K1Y947_9SPHI|nr:GNAT family N-acetyltransferase [Hufsiella arboris]MXV50558.1 GNAT family N-acetyltransferase [Hufsiella arboris]
MNYVLETSRLVLRQFTLDDTRFIIELLNSPGWLKFIGDRSIKSEEQARRYLQDVPLKSYEINGYGLCMVQTKDEGIPVGMCGLIRRDSLDHPDIGFAFLPEFQGKGYAFEIAAAVLGYAKNTLELSVVLAIVIPENERSIRLLKKLGMAFSRMIDFSDTGEELMLFSS